MEKEVDNDVRMKYLKNTMLNENYPTYQYYMAIREVANSILPEVEQKFLKLGDK